MLKFHPDISFEIKSSYLWYQEQAEGLGEDFLEELDSAFLAIGELSHTWPLFHGDFRRFLLAKFPYAVIYLKNENDIYVVAVMHNSRKPGYWLSRT